MKGKTQPSDDAAAFGGFRAFYSRPPFFSVVTAPTADALAAKVAELDARIKAQDAQS